MLTTAGVTFSRIGASVGTPSRSGAPDGICAAAAPAMQAIASEQKTFFTTCGPG